MSFPPRPPMVPPGMPYMPPGMVPMPLPPHMMTLPPGVPPPAYHAPPRPGAPLLPPPTTTKPPPLAGPPPTIPVSNGQGPSSKKGEMTDGPPVTVFVGNITPRAPDAMIRYILTACGPVLNWKRVSAFGFCEFASPEAGLRCVRLLHDREIGEKKLVARVDAKTKTLLDKYKTEQRDKLSAEGNMGMEDKSGGTPPPEDYMDDKQRSLDENTLKRIEQLIAEYQDDMKNYEAIQKEEQMEKTNRVLEEADIEEEKRDVIHREIGKFREIMKVWAVLDVSRGV